MGRIRMIWLKNGGVEKIPPSSVGAAQLTPFKKVFNYQFSLILGPETLDITAKRRACGAYLTITEPY